MSSLRDMIVDITSEDEAEKFGAWAFGEGYEILDHSLLFLAAWNKNHSDLLELKEDGWIEIDLPRMVDLWHANGSA
jgi:hypothetical protein